MKKERFGITADGIKIYKFILKNRFMQVELINFGATIVSIKVPDRNGKVEDVTLGYSDLKGYENDTVFFGSIVGRFGNRIRNGKFSLNGKSYQLAINSGNHHLHGGNKGFNKEVWDYFVVPGKENAVKFSYTSPDGEENYPGTLTIDVVYELTIENGIKIDYSASTDKPTILNPTNHTYFNLSGNPTNTILDHIVRIDADAYTESDQDQIVTGKIVRVDGTPLDFRIPSEIGERIDDTFDQLTYAGGYDQNYVLNNYKGSVRSVGKVYHKQSGRSLEIATDQPGMQFYTGNYLNDSIKGKEDVCYGKRTGFCMETQHFPDSPNHPDFPSVVLEPGEKYRQTTIYKFDIKDSIL
jgi:aldose 1-epimerase